MVERCFVLECPTTQIDQAAILRVAAALAEFSVQRGIFGIRKDIYKRR